MRSRRQFLGETSCAAIGSTSILSTLLAARRDLELPDGHWPSQWEYSEWAEIKRRLTRRSGKGPRIPGLKPIRKAFGGYDISVARPE